MAFHDVDLPCNLRHVMGTHVNFDGSKGRGEQYMQGLTRLLSHPMHFGPSCVMVSHCRSFW